MRQKCRIFSKILINCIQAARIRLLRFPVRSLSIENLEFKIYNFPVMSKVFDFIKKNIAAPTLPNIRIGDTVKVYQKITEGKKERVQIFEGLIISRHNKNPLQATITVRKIASGVGVERIFPLVSNKIEKIEIVRSSKVRRAKLYYMRSLVGKSAKMKDEVAPAAVK